MSDVLAYAGIGSRKCSMEELQVINQIAGILAEHNFVCYTGGAPGADDQFLHGSGGKAVIFLPWEGFEAEALGRMARLDRIVAGSSPIGDQMTLKYHPRSKDLQYGPRKLMNRNAHQILGWEPQWPRVKFVVCSARPTFGKPGEVDGGTGHAVRIANDLGIPVVNLRVLGWMDRLVQLVADAKKPRA